MRQRRTPTWTSSYDGIILGAGPQRAHPAGLSRQGRAQGAGARAQGGRRRRARHARGPAPSRFPAQHPRVLPARHHHHAVVRGPRARASRRALHRAGAQRRAADRRRPRAGMVDRHRAHRRVVRASSASATPTRCGAGITSSCRSCETSWRRKAGSRRCRRTSGEAARAQRGRTAAARGERAARRSSS